MSNKVEPTAGYTINARGYVVPIEHLSNGKSLVTKKGIVEEGTKFRSTYKGITHYGKVKDGFLVVKGKKFKSLSGAAKAITKYPINGWKFWKYADAFDS